MLGRLSHDDWRTPALRGLDIQGLVGHLIGVEDDVQRCLAGDPEMAGASHVESTQAAATAQGGRPPARTQADWRRAADRTLDLVRPADPGQVAIHGMRLSLGALLVVGLSSCGLRERHPPGGWVGRIPSPTHPPCG